MENNYRYKVIQPNSGYILLPTLGDMDAKIPAWGRTTVTSKRLNTRNWGAINH